MKADILAYYPTSLIGRLIVRVTKGDVSHVCIVVGNDLVMDAGWFGIKLRKTDTSSHIQLTCPDLYEEQRDVIVDYAMNTVDCKYDYKHFVAVGMYKLFGVKLSWMRSDKFICVEHVYEAYKSIGIDIVPQITDDAYTTPSDLLNSPVLERVLT
jgi:hypothetical protein